MGMDEMPEATRCVSDRQSSICVEERRAFASCIRQLQSPEALKGLSRGRCAPVVLEFSK